MTFFAISSSCFIFYNRLAAINAISHLLYSHLERKHMLRMEIMRKKTSQIDELCVKKNQMGHVQACARLP